MSITLATQHLCPHHAKLPVTLPDYVVSLVSLEMCQRWSGDLSAQDCSVTFFSVSKNDGHPDPESNLYLLGNSSVLQQTQVYMPRCSFREKQQPYSGHLSPCSHCTSQSKPSPCRVPWLPGTAHLIVTLSTPCQSPCPGQTWPWSPGLTHRWSQVGAHSGYEETFWI